MRLVFKLTTALVVGMCLVLVLNGFLTMRDQLALMQSDVERDHVTMGQAVGAALVKVRQGVGESEAKAVLQSVNRQRQVQIRWVRLDVGPDEAQGQSLPPEQIEALASGQPVSLVRPGPDGRRWTFTYVPASGLDLEARAPGQHHRVAAVELSESLDFEDRYTRSSLLRIGLTTLSILGVCGAIALVSGLHFVGRPVRALIHKAERTGAGDFAGRLVLAGKDELADLAGAMNSMCEQLAEAQQKLVSETGARISALEQLRHAERLATVGKLASGIAHELGTPLNVVQGRAQMIASGELEPAEIAANACTIVTQSERITKIIRELLDFARRQPPQKEAQELWPILLQTQLLLKPIAEKHKVRLRAEGTELQALAEVDAGQLQQGVTNLVLNAIQAMPHGGELTLGLARETLDPPADHGGPAGEYFRLDVRDQGVGITPEVLDRIFEPFFTTKPVGEGTGLGLSVTYGIVREHGGWIAVQSQPGHGSRFSIYLPGVSAP